MEPQTLVSVHSCMDASVLQLLLSFQTSLSGKGQEEGKRGSNGNGGINRNGQQSWQRGEQRCRVWP